MIQVNQQYFYLLIDEPAQRNFVKNMISGISENGVPVLMIPANKGCFENATATGNHKKWCGVFFRFCLV